MRHALAAMLVGITLGCSAPGQQQATVVAGPAAAPTAAFDVGAIPESVYFGFREEEGEFTGWTDTYQVTARPDGRWTLRPTVPAGAASPGAPAARARRIGAPIAVETAAIRRGAALGSRGAARPVAGGSLVIDHGIATEELKNTSEGVEQSWRFETKPAGEGDLLVQVALTGERYVGETANGLHFADSEQEVGVRYGLATWVDAKGVKTAVRPRFADGRVSLVVPAAVVEASAFPAVLDPFLSTEVTMDGILPASVGQTLPVVAKATAKGVGSEPNNYLVAWVDNREGPFGTTTGAFAVLVSPTGTVITPVKAVSYSIDMAAGVGAVYDTTNYLVACVGSDNKLRGVRMNPTTGDPIVTFFMSNEFSPSVKRGVQIGFASGQSLVVYTKQFATPIVVGVRVAAGANAVTGNTFTIYQHATSGADQPAASGDGGGTYQVVFRVSGTRTQPLPRGIKAQRVNADGTLGGPVMNVNGDNPGNNPSITYGDGKYFMAWSDTRSVPADILYAWNMSPSGVGCNFPPAKPDGLIAFHDDAGADGRDPAVAWDGYAFNIAFGVSGASQSIKGRRVDKCGNATIGETFPIAASSGINGIAAASRFANKTLVAYSTNSPAPAGPLRIKARLIDGKAPGAPCNTAADCDLGFCLGGVCCASACDDANACTNDTCGLPGGTGACVHTNVNACVTAVCGLGVCAGPDTDGDGLSNAWENNGYVDINCNGVNDGPAVDLPLPGANPLVKDIYLEYDYMDDGAHSHAPSAAAVQAVVDAFALRGITLHIDPIHEVLPHNHVLTFFPIVSACTGPDAADFYALKAAHFDSKRAPVYHYAIFAHHSTCDPPLCGSGFCSATVDPGATGIAELPGNDFIVSTGSFNDIAVTPTVENEAGLLMHELGHNFGLDHGGDGPSPEFKPNFLSVMNRNFTFPGIPVAASLGSIIPKSCLVPADCAPDAAICTSSNICVRIDYSNAALPTLNEASLSESSGIVAGTKDITTYLCPDFSLAFGAGSGPIDWNCVSPADQVVSVDVSGDGATTTLTGFNDWAALNPAFQCTVAFANGPPPPDQISKNEPSAGFLVQRNLLLPAVGVVIDVRPGQNDNWIDLGSNATVPVLIHGSATFNVNQIDQSTLRFAGRAPVSTAIQDVDGDRYLDLQAQYVMSGLNLTPQSTSATQKGSLTSSQSFHGSDAVRVF